MQTIWKNLDMSLDDLNEMCKDTMIGRQGIKFTEIAKDHLRATMPVDKRNMQPFGILHGGASAVLIETIGSVASTLVVDYEKKACVGLSLNVNHLRAVSEGHVHAAAYPLHTGRSTHVWDVKLLNDADELVAVGRITVAVIDKKKNSRLGIFKS